MLRKFEYILFIEPIETTDKVTGVKSVSDAGVLMESSCFGESAPTREELIWHWRGQIETAGLAPQHIRVVVREFK